MRIFIATFLSILCMAIQAGENGYRLIEGQSSKAVGCWINSYHEYTQIIGYSDLGHIFLFNPSDNDYAVFYPYKGAAKSYGAFNSKGDFERQVLLDSGFINYVLKTDHVSKIRLKLGPLSINEVYIAQPYPFLAGSQNVESYKKGDIWVMLGIVAQLREDCL